MYICDSRHGRVLMKKIDEGELLLWDPLTGGEHCIPTPPGYPYNYDTRFGAALICDADDHGGHADCHSSPYRVAFAYSERRYSEASDLPEHRISACVYSSQTGTWGNLTSISSLIFFHTFARKPCVVMDGNVVYWILLRDRTVLQFNIEAQSLTMIKPFTNAFDLIVPTPNGRLGLVYVNGTSVVLSEREVNSGLGKWNCGDLVRLQDFIPPDALFSEVSSDQEERPGYRTWNIFGRLPGYELNGIEDNLIVDPRVIGFSEEENVVFVQSKVGVFTIDLVSKRNSKVSNQTACFDAIHPYSSFYTTETDVVYFMLILHQLVKLFSVKQQGKLITRPTVLKVKKLCLLLALELITKCSIVVDFQRGIKIVALLDI
ncbi:hypothetical protein EJB05_23043, partial [Eragrostis curvula]